MNDDIKYIHTEYWIKKRSIEEIAKSLTIRETEVIMFMRENDIPVRQKDKKLYNHICLGPNRVKMKPEIREFYRNRKQRKIASTLINDERFKIEQLIKLHSQGRYKWLTLELFKEVKKNGDTVN